MAARQDRQPHDMDAFFQRRVDDLCGRQADAFVDDLHAGVAGPHGDLFGAVGMTVQPRLADQDLDPPAQLFTDRGDFFLDRRHLAAGGLPRRPADAGGGPIFAVDLAKRRGPFAAGDPGMGAGDGGVHDVAAVAGRPLQPLQGGRGGFAVTGVPPGGEPGDLLSFRPHVHRQDAAVAGGQRAGSSLGEFVDADHHLFAGFDGGQTPAVGFHQLLFHIAGLDGSDRTAHGVDARQFLAGLGLQRLDLGGDFRRAVENIAIVQQVGLIGDDLLQAQRPLLVPWPGQSQGLVPGRQLDGPCPGVLRQGHRQHFQQDAIDVIFRLLFGEAQRIDLHAIAEAAHFFVGDTIAVAADLVPQFAEGAHLAKLGDEADAGVDEEADASHHLGEFGRRDLSRRLHPVQHGDGGGQREGQFLLGRGASFLQMVGADIHRIPLGNFAVGEGDDVGGQLQRRLRRKDIGAARQIFLDDVVLRRAGQRRAGRALLFGGGDVKRQQPGGRRVDGHRGVHLVQRDAVEQGHHVTQMTDGNANLAHFALGQRMIRIIAGLGWQIEGDGQSGLSPRQVGAEQFVAFHCRRMPRIGAEHPRFFAMGWLLFCLCGRHTGHKTLQLGTFNEIISVLNYLIFQQTGECFALKLLNCPLFAKQTIILCIAKKETKR